MPSCTNCDHPLSASDRFCAQCGTPQPVPTACGSCGAALQAEDQFCGSCGTPRPAAAAPVSPPPSEAASPPPPESARQPQATGPPEADQEESEPSSETTNRGCVPRATIALIILCAAAVVVFLVGRTHPQGALGIVRDAFDQDTSRVSTDTEMGETDLARPMIDRVRPGVRPLSETPSIRPRPGATDGASPAAPVTEPIRPRASGTASSATLQRATLGNFPVYRVTRSWNSQGPLNGRPVSVSMSIPTTWTHSEGQLFDPRGNKAGDIGAGLITFVDGASCATRPADEMNGPPDEEFAFDFQNVRGVYRRTESHCGGGVDTYAGACQAHSYCIDPAAGGLGLIVLFLEASSSASPAMKATYDRIVDSIRLQQ